MYRVRAAMNAGMQSGDPLPERLRTRRLYSARAFFAASLCASAIVHAVVLGALPPFLFGVEAPTVTAIDVLIMPPQTVQSAVPPREVPAVTKARRRDHMRNARRIAQTAAAIKDVEHHASTAHTMNETRVSNDPNPAAREAEAILAQPDAKRPTVALTPVAGIASTSSADSAPENPARTRAPGTGTVAAMRASSGIIAPTYNAGYLRNRPPRYPLVARRNGEQGTVMVKVLVTQQGRAGDVLLEKTSGSAALDAAALESVRRWRFTPAMQEGRAVDAWVLVPIVFRLQETS